jgi:hypothetical protein
MFDPSTGDCRLVDDLDFSDAVTTVHYRLDGIHYEVALSAGNLENLRGVLKPYIAVSHIVGRDRYHQAARPNTDEARESQE